MLFVRGGFSRGHDAAAVRHAHAAIIHGRDDATALGVAAFVIAMVEHDRRAAIEAFETALALSPSCSLALISAAPQWGGAVRRSAPWNGASELSASAPLTERDMGRIPPGLRLAIS